MSLSFRETTALAQTWERGTEDTVGTGDRSFCCHPPLGAHLSVLTLPPPQNTLPCIPQGNQLQGPSQFLHLAPNPGSQTKQHPLQQIWVRFFMISQPTN